MSRPDDIIDLSDDLEVEIHPYFRGRLPLDVARKVQACLNDSEAKAQAAVKALRDELAAAQDTARICSAQIGAVVAERDAARRDLQRLVDRTATDWGKVKGENDALKVELKQLKAKLAGAEARPKRRVNAPNWARMLAR